MDDEDVGQLPEVDLLGGRCAALALWAEPAFVVREFLDLEVLLDAGGQRCLTLPEMYAGRDGYRQVHERLEFDRVVFALMARERRFELPLEDIHDHRFIDFEVVLPGVGGVLLDVVPMDEVLLAEVLSDLDAVEVFVEGIEQES